MTPVRLQTIEEIFHAALECEPGQLSAFLDRTCAGDDVLRRKVEELLGAHKQADSFIETPVADVASSIAKDRQRDLLIGQTIGHYEILEEIGRGGMGEVYLASDITAGRKAALKLLPARFTGDASRLKRFQQEARAVVGLNHPNILTVYEIGADSLTHYIASELIEGETLRQRLRRGRMQLSEAVEISVQIASALAAAHEAGIIHRDVKPENIMLRPDGYVKVLDFGIAKLAEQDVPITIPKEEALLLVETNLGSILGTVRYMSPEQARGASIDRRTDIWSLGIVLYEMAAGHAPFSSDIPREVMTAILATEPPPLSSHMQQVPDDLQQIVGKALRKDPERRYQNASEMLEALKTFRRRLEFAAEIMAKRPPRKSIAVLPFENLSEDKANEYLADGIQEEILTRLSRIGDLKVISRSSTQRFKNSVEQIPDIAKQLGVAHILEGSVRNAGDKVRVHVQLIDADNDAHLWAERYDRQLDDIFAVETDIAAKIAEALQAKLTGAERRAISAQPTRNVEAHELYLKGRYHWRNFYAPGYERVREYFEQAVARDPFYAPAYSGLSLYYSWAAANGIFPPDGWPLAEEFVHKALSLDDTLAEAYNARAAVELYYKRNWTAAEQTFRRGAELNPNFADIPAHYGLCLSYFGRFEEAIAQQDRALELDPFFPGLNVHYGVVLFFSRDYDRAASQLAKTLEMYPDNAAAHEYFGNVCEQKGMRHEAITRWTAALNLSGQAEHARVLEQVFSTAGFEAAVRTLAQRQLEDLDCKRSSGGYVPAAQYVFTHVRRGAFDDALAWLPKMVEEPNWFAFQLRVNPILDPLQTDPRFEKLANQIIPPDVK